MGTFSKFGKVFAPLAAAAAIMLTPVPTMAGGEMPSMPQQQQQICPDVPTPVRKQWTACDLVLYYVPNRVLDFIDIFRLNVGIGCGYGFNVRLTELAEIGIGQYETTRFGMKGRVLPVYEENICESGVAFLGCVQGCLQRDPSEIGADVHLWCIGAQAAVSVAEAVDFVAGFILLDPQQDDLGPNPWD